MVVLVTAVRFTQYKPRSVLWFLTSLVAPGQPEARVVDVRHPEVVLHVAGLVVPEHAHFTLAVHSEVHDGAGVGAHGAQIVAALRVALAVLYHLYHVPQPQQL